MLSLDLTPVQRARAIANLYRHLVKSGIPASAARTISSGQARQLSLDNLERLCLILRCTPNDLLTWKPPEGTAAAGQPLATLSREAGTGLEWVDKLQDLPVERLRELGKILGAVQTDAGVG